MINTTERIDSAIATNLRSICADEDGFVNDIFGLPVFVGAFVDDAGTDLVGNIMPPTSRPTKNIDK